jgi:AraC-like DNA-binding protein
LDLVGDAQGESTKTSPPRLPTVHGLGADLVVDNSDLATLRGSCRVPGVRRPWRPLDSVREYVEVNLHKSLTVVELASVTGLSPTHFSRLFRQAVGESPHRYVRRRRVERAEGLIVGTDLSFRVIAELVGFSDQSHLNRVIRAERGLTPGQLRQAVRSGRSPGSVETRRLRR